MKVLMVAEDVGVVNQLKAILGEIEGVQVFAYTLLFKALDNLDEIDPDWVVISAVDFPRHWKLFVRYLRSPVFNKHHDVLLVTDSKFNSDDQEKARLLEVTNLVEENALIDGASPSFDALFRANEIQCIFQHPLNGCLVTGTVLAQSKGNSDSNDILRFRPALVPLEAFCEGDEIDSASVKVGGQISAARFIVQQPKLGYVPLKSRTY
jgi:hypothetical protein